MMLSENQLKTLCKTATKAAIAAGEYIQTQFNKHYNKKHKAVGNSLASQVVTEVDVKAQEIVLQQLRGSIELYDLGLLTEETADNHSRLEKDYFWCVDPMDGTLPFTEGRTGYAVSIALITKAGDPVVGVVYIPDLDDCYTSIKGAGVCLNDKPFTHEGESEVLHIYLDRSMQSATYYNQLIKQLEYWAAVQNIAQVRYHFDYGAVRNALGVMNSGNGCYFKFPKEAKGGGSIWDYAATRLFFEELGFYVSNASGKPLSLNAPDTTFMNKWGVTYASSRELWGHIMLVGNSVK